MNYKNKNKKGFQTKNLIIGGVLFSAIVLLFAFSFTGLSNNYPNNPTLVNDDLANNYNKLFEQTTTVEIMQNESLGEEGLEFRGNFDVTFGSFFTVVKLMFGSVNLLGGMGDNIVGDFGFIDPNVVNILILVALTILTVSLVLSLVNAVGRNPI